MLDNQGFVNIYTIFKEVRRQWLLFLIVFLVCVLSSILVSIIASPRYEAEITLMPVAQLDENSPNSGLNVVTSLLGKGSVSSDIPAWSEAVIVMQTRAFSKDFIVSQNITNFLIKYYGYDNKWEDLTEAQKIVRLDQVARKWTENSIKIAQDEFTNVITFSVNYSDRKLAAEWATLYVRDINARMKKYLIEDTEHKISFYRERIREEKVADIRISLIELLSSAMQQKALIDTRDEIVLRTVDPADVSILKFPILILNVAIGIFLGLILGFISVIFNSTYQRYMKLDSSND